MPMNQGTFEEKMKRVDWLAEQSKMAAMTLPKSGLCIVDEASALMDAVYFKALGEYSASLPTGTYIGKRWKRNAENAPQWKCSVCDAKFAGWGSEGQRCPGAPGPCDGTLSRIEVAADWSMGEYFDMGSEDKVGIKWRKILLL